MLKFSAHTDFLQIWTIIFKKYITTNWRRDITLVDIRLCTEYIFYCKRAILFLSSSKILTPHPPLRPASLSSPRNKGGGTHSPGGEGDGGSIFWKTREIGLPSYSKICNLCVCAKSSWIVCIAYNNIQCEKNTTRAGSFVMC
jgi:hypothetical protein